MEALDTLETVMFLWCPSHLVPAISPGDGGEWCAWAGCTSSRVAWSWTVGTIPPKWVVHDDRNHQAAMTKKWFHYGLSHVYSGPNLKKLEPTNSIADDRWHMDLWVSNIEQHPQAANQGPSGCQEPDKAPQGVIGPQTESWVSHSNFFETAAPRIRKAPKMESR